MNLESRGTYIFFISTAFPKNNITRIYSREQWIYVSFRFDIANFRWINPTINRDVTRSVRGVRDWLGDRLKLPSLSLRILFLPRRKWAGLCVVNDIPKSSLIGSANRARRAQNDGRRHRFICYSNFRRKGEKADGGTVHLCRASNFFVPAGCYRKIYDELKRYLAEALRLRFTFVLSYFSFHSLSTSLLLCASPRSIGTQFLKHSPLRLDSTPLN